MSVVQSTYMFWLGVFYPLEYPSCVVNTVFGAKSFQNKMHAT